MKSSFSGLIKSSTKRKAPTDLSGVAITKHPKKLIKKMANLSNNTSQDTVILPTPIKSESDRKEYRLIRLSNGLTALLIDSTHAVPVSLIKDADDTTSEEESVSENEEEEESSDEEVEYESIATSEEDSENMAACSLMVDVGSFSDPKNIQVSRVYVMLIII